MHADGPEEHDTGWGMGRERSFAFLMLLVSQSFGGLGDLGTSAILVEQDSLCDVEYQVEERRAGPQQH